ncbi:ABC transporter ATP-binding protein [Ruminococcus sp.]|uniref:ABC transporter ATP-binding protein n=1 Tax=Ruminococcus sp. TaxID=41978 RepID=UPI0025F7D6FA|nr:ABC transporter ATP-binding protein [Ruminococcus sp.]
MNYNRAGRSDTLSMMVEVSKPYRKIMIIMIVAGFICSACDSVFPLFNRYALDHYVADKTLDTLKMFIFLYVLLLVIQVAGSYISAILCGMIEVSVNRDLRNRSFRHIQELSLSYFNSNSVGSIHSRIMSDTSKIGETVAWRLMDIVWSGAYLVSILFNMLVISPSLFLAVFLLIIAAAVISMVFQGKLIKINRLIREQNSVITGDLNEMVTGVRTIKTMTIEKKMEKKFFEDTEKMRSVSVRSGRLSALFSSTVSFVSALALSVVLWKGGRLTIENAMLIGNLSVFMSYALGMLGPVQSIVNTLSQFIAIRANWERYIKLMEVSPDVSDTPEVISRYGDSFAPKRENWEPMKGDIFFDNVSFRYPDGDTEVLTNFTLDIPKGSMVAIVGETGAGKSTLVNLVCRFYEPTKGRVLLDGKDLRERSVMWLHSHIGYVLQTPHLFSGTIRENLMYGKPDATEEEIYSALKAVYAFDIVEELEGGLDSIVGEGGNSLSTGQKQLISFARAVLADPDILILDEATASVDTITEKKIQSAIKTLTANRTTFVIAHRLSTIVDADMIIAVNNGKIAEQGSHAELMAKKGYYYSLYTRQHEDIDRVLNDI